MLFTARLHVPYATNNKDQGSVATECGALCGVFVNSLNRSYFRHKYSPSPVVLGQSHLIPDPLRITFHFVMSEPTHIGSGISSDCPKGIRLFGYWYLAYNQKLSHWLANLSTGNQKRGLTIIRGSL